MSITARWHTGLASLLHRLALDEQRCALCLAPFSPFVPSAASSALPSAALPLCPDCVRKLPRRQAGFCPHCGEPAAQDDLPVAPCGRCLKEPPPWSTFRFYGVYENTLRELLQRAKFRADLPATALAGGLLALACSGLPQPDAIIPVPLHPERLRQRGSNQCAEMARPLAHALRVPVRHDLLHRILATPSQTGLPRKRRVLNLKSAFCAFPQCAGLRLLLIDDTMTTGTTLLHAANTLLGSGAAEVSVAVVARTSRHLA